MKWFIDHIFDYDEDIIATDLWVIIEMLVDYIKTEEDEERSYRVMNNIKSLIKGVIGTAL